MAYSAPMLHLSWLIAIINFSSMAIAQTPDAMGYALPTSGTASTTQFYVGPEFGSGTACGANGWANGAAYGNPPAGGGPGFLYAAINQLAFGANPLGGT